jgi:hypothetical protein
MKKTRLKRRQGVVTEGKKTELQGINWVRCNAILYHLPSLFDPPFSPLFEGAVPNRMVLEAV